ncbi:MAG: hypothetical protein WD431_25575 [Cyclobacteriaceae bacterium]
MKLSLPEADRHDENVTGRDDYKTPACRQVRDSPEKSLPGR